MRGPELLTYDLGQGVCAFSTERRGGYSEGAYASFNANAYCGDDERTVRFNRDLLCESLGLETSRLIIPHQIHGARVRCIDEAFFMQTDAVKAATLEGVDAVMTDVPKVCVSVSTADCIPILIYDRVHHAVAAVHAGWRSTVLRISEAVLHTAPVRRMWRRPSVPAYPWRLSRWATRCMKLSARPVSRWRRWRGGILPLETGVAGWKNGTLICGKPIGTCWRAAVCLLRGFVWPECALTSIPNVSSPHAAWASVRGAS